PTRGRAAPAGAESYTPTWAVSPSRLADSELEAQPPPNPTIPIAIAAAMIFLPESQSILIITILPACGGSVPAGTCAAVAIRPRRRVAAIPMSFSTAVPGSAMHFTGDLHAPLMRPGDRALARSDTTPHHIISKYLKIPRPNARTDGDQP